MNISVAEPKGKSPIGRNRCRWEDNNKMYLQELDCEDWVYLA
jgi:hypothetical protein